MRRLATFGGVSVLFVFACEPQEPTYSVEEAAGSSRNDEGRGALAGAAGATPVSSGGAGGEDIVVAAGSAGSAGNGTTEEAGDGRAAPQGEAGREGEDGVTATATFHGTPGGTAIFMQHGTDVTVTVNLTNCAEGRHPILICEGFSCDSPAVEGDRWDGQRGSLGASADASAVDCQNDKSGTLTYTREGADPATRWTVSDHDVMYDVTNRVIVITDVGNGPTRLSCADFR
jgi:hypothetical protein